MISQESLLQKVVYASHADIHVGELSIGAHSVISPGCRIDLTGSVTIGEYCMIGEGTKILSHDHFHEGRTPLLLLQKEKGVKWQDKVIENDVWIHGAIILYQVTHIPRGTVIGAGAILTKNPENEYEIWSGNPAIPIDVRSKYQDAKYSGEVDTELAFYISGFVDGEGCFSQGRSQGNPEKSSVFRFILESDARDRGLYLEIAKIFGCGQLRTRRRGKYSRMIVFTIRSIPELIMKVIPFFDTWKLRGLKRIKYRHWRERLLDYVVNNEWACTNGSGKRSELLAFINESFNPATLIGMR